MCIGHATAQATPTRQASHLHFLQGPRGSPPSLPSIARCQALQFRARERGSTLPGHLAAATTSTSAVASSSGSLNGLPSPSARASALAVATANTPAYAGASVARCQGPSVALPGTSASGSGSLNGLPSPSTLVSGQASPRHPGLPAYKQGLPWDNAANTMSGCCNSYTCVIS